MFTYLRYRIRKKYPAAKVASKYYYIIFDIGLLYNTVTTIWKYL
jgi:hypothetical protein